MRKPYLRLQAPFRLQARVRVLAALVVTLGFTLDASAVLTLVPTATPRKIIMQVGSAGSTVNNVTFNVTGANISPNPVAVTGVPSADTPASSPTGGTEVSLTTTNEAGKVYMNLTVDSSTGLICQSTSCGGTVIPFNTISWTSYNHGTAYQTLDIQDGTFTGSSSQPLALRTMTNTGIKITNVLIFRYNNTTLYPAGQYKGTVRYTAAIP